MEHRPIDIHNNQILCALDMTDATEQQQRAWLTQIIDNELERGDQMDEALVCECLDQLAMLAGDDVMTPSACRAHLKRFLAAQAVKDTERPLPSRSRRPLFLRLRSAAFAAVLIVIFFALMPRIYAYALAEHDDKLYRETVNRELLYADSDLTSNATEQTYLNDHEEIYYDMASFIQNYGHLDFRYPHNLQIPDPELRIHSIRVTYHYEKSWIVIFVFSDARIKNFVVQALAQPSHMIEQASSEKYLATGYQNYAVTEREINGFPLYHAECVTDGIRYSAEAYDYQALRLILSKTANTTHRQYRSVEEVLGEHDYLQDFIHPQERSDVFQIQKVTLSYRGTRSWELTLNISTVRTHFTSTIHISPVAVGTEFEPQEYPLILSNDTARLYLISKGFTPTYGHYEARCIVDDMQYDIKVYGYREFVTVAESLFGPLSE